MCALTYDLGKTSTPVAEYDSPTNGQWVNQDRFIAVARGGSYTASTTSNTTNGSGSSSNIAPCHLDYTFINGYGYRDHWLYASGNANVANFESPQRGAWSSQVVWFRTARGNANQGVSGTTSAQDHGNPYANIGDQGTFSAISRSTGPTTACRRTTCSSTRGRPTSSAGTRCRRTRTSRARKSGNSRRTARTHGRATTSRSGSPPGTTAGVASVSTSAATRPGDGALDAMTGPVAVRPGPSAC
jgi:hypothetical protein